MMKSTFHDQSFSAVSESVNLDTLSMLASMYLFLEAIADSSMCLQP